MPGNRSTAVQSTGRSPTLLGRLRTGIFTLRHVFPTSVGITWIPPVSAVIHVRTSPTPFMGVPLPRVSSVIHQGLPNAPDLSERRVLYGFTHTERVPPIYTYLVHVAKYIIWPQKNDFRFRDIPPSAATAIASIAVGRLIGSQFVVTLSLPLCDRGSCWTLGVVFADPTAKCHSFFFGLRGWSSLILLPSPIAPLRAFVVVFIDPTAKPYVPLWFLVVVFIDPTAKTCIVYLYKGYFGRNRKAPRAKCILSVHIMQPWTLVAAVR